MIYLYSIFSTVVWVYFVSRAKRKKVVGLILFWLYSTPILYLDSFINIPGINININSVRLLFVGVLVLYLTSIFGINNYRYGNLPKYGYEKWMILLVFSVYISESMNIQSFGIDRYISDISYVTTFVLLYFTIKWNITKDDIYILCRGFLVFAYISAIISYLQFLIDPSIMHIGVYRIAFGSFERASGLFPNEFDQAAFLSIVSLLNWALF